MSSRPCAAALLGALLTGLAPACSRAWPALAPVSVEILRDDGRPFAHHPYPGVVEPGSTRRYVEAEYGARYRVQVRNASAERIAIVLAVDGRNAISGARSELAATEPMYVLAPYQTQWFDGWRGDRHSVQRFYFTDPGDAYASAFGDTTALGVIAVAAFRSRQSPTELMLPRADRVAPGQGIGDPAAAERAQPLPSAPPPQPAAPHAGDGASRAAPAARAGGYAEGFAPHGPPAGAAAGTGYGERRHSPVRYTRFDPEPVAAVRHFLKYEWRATLAAMGVLDAPPPPPHNRFWPAPPGPFAPPPPR